MISQDSKFTVVILSHLLVVHHGLEAPGPPGTEGSSTELFLEGFLPAPFPSHPFSRCLLGPCYGPGTHTQTGIKSMAILLSDSPPHSPQDWHSPSQPSIPHPLTWTSLAHDVRWARSTYPAYSGLSSLPCKFQPEYSLQPPIHTPPHSLLSGIIIYFLISELLQGRKQILLP